MTKVQKFRHLHSQEKPLLIGNVWNVQSAKIYEKLNFQAIATSSAAIAHSLGYNDGEEMSFSEYLFMIKRILKSTHLPLSVDLEAGYGKTTEEIFELLRLLGIENLIDKYPNEISGGQRQRVAIARAMVNNPKVIFADEPTGNLDSENSLNVFELFSTLAKKGTTIIVATHDKNLALKTDITYEVKDGKLI